MRRRSDNEIARDETLAATCEAEHADFLRFKARAPIFVALARDVSGLAREMGADAPEWLRVLASDARAALGG